MTHVRLGSGPGLFRRDTRQLCTRREILHVNGSRQSFSPQSWEASTVEHAAHLTVERLIEVFGSAVPQRGVVKGALMRDP